MHHHNLFITFLTLFIFFFNPLTAFTQRNLTGEWKPIPDVTDPTVVDIGKFAVDEHNKKDHASLTFGKVVKGETQVVAGTNYNLTITATSDGSGEKNYVALVWDKPWVKFRRLVSFKGPV